MRLNRIVATALLAGSVGLSAGAAGAATNPSTTGQPSQSCQAQPSSPGHASSSPGAPFNEPTATSPGGKGGAAYNAGNANSPNPKAVSQYDVACYQVSH